MDRRDFLKLGALAPVAVLPKQLTKVPDLQPPTETYDAFIRVTWEAQQHPDFHQHLQEVLSQLGKVRIVAKHEDYDYFITKFYLKGEDLPKRVEGCPSLCLATIGKHYIWMPDGGIREVRLA